jgi:hypothetical protein
MLAALLEWFLWLAAFLYCLIKVFQKAEHWSIRVLAVIVIFLFTALRYESKLYLLRWRHLLVTDSLFPESFSSPS